MVVFAGLAGVGLEPAIPSAPLPQGDGRFSLGMSRGAFDSLTSQRGVKILSEQSGYVATTSDRELVEFERYAFFHDGTLRPLLWRVTIAYTLPYTRADFGRIEAELRELLGDPKQVTDVDHQDTGTVPSRAISWSDGFTVVQLAGRWPEIPDPRADRMLVTWTDSRIKRSVDARRKRQRDTPHGR